MEFSEVIRERRTELGMSQRDLATAAGVDVRQIRRYEAGEQQPLLTVAVAIADALGVSVGELAGKPTYQVKLAAADFRNSPLSITGIPQGTSGAEGLG